MSSEKLGHHNNVLKGDLGGAFNILTGSTGEQTDLGIAKKLGGAEIAYSLRDIGAMNGPVVKVRRDSDEAERDFSAIQVSNGDLETWVQAGTTFGETSATAFSFHGQKATGGLTVSDGINGFTLDVDTDAAYAGYQLSNTIDNGDKIYISFNASLSEGSGAATPQVKLRSVNIQGSGTSDTYEVIEGFNAFELTSSNDASEYLSFSEGDDNKRFTISDMRVSLTSRNGFVRTWYDQTGGGKDMFQETGPSQPYIIQNGGSHNGIFAPVDLSSSTSKKHLRSLFRNQDYPANTTKITFLAVTENMTSKGSGNSGGTIFGSYRNVANYVEGQLGLTIEGTIGRVGLKNGLASANDLQGFSITDGTATNNPSTNKAILVGSVNDKTVTMFINNNTSSGDFTGAGLSAGTNETVNISSDASTDADKNYYRIFAPNRDNAVRADNFSYGRVRECILFSGNPSVDDLTALRDDLNLHYKYY